VEAVHVPEKQEPVVVRNQLTMPSSVEYTPPASLDVKSFAGSASVRSTSDAQVSIVSIGKIGVSGKIGQSGNGSVSGLNAARIKFASMQSQQSGKMMSGN
jgi:hypothetical protein